MRSVVLASLAALSASGAPELRTLTPVEMQEDLFLLTDKVTSLHSGLARYFPAQVFEENSGALLARAGEGPRDVRWFHREVSALIAGIGCGHSGVRLGERDRAAVLAQRGLLPIEVLLDGERAWITRVLAPESGLRPGQELLAIDGLALSEIRARAFARISPDGFIESGRQRRLEATFPETYALLVDEASSGPYELRLAGVAEPVRVAGLAPEAYRAARGPERVRPVVALEIRAADGVGVLTVSEFGDPAANEPSFTAALETAFRTLREREVPHLVLDLRGNGGGVDMYGALLVSYLAHAPFGYFERIEVTPAYSGAYRIEERDGRRLMLSHEGLTVQQPAELAFRGDVIVLIDGLTFSTAADVATVAHANHLATFLGDETGGGYEGNNSGDSQPVVLPSSGITVNVPLWCYTTAGVGSGHHGRGVEPDEAVHASIEDVLVGRDVVLERAFERFRASAGR